MNVNNYYEISKILKIFANYLQNNPKYLLHDIVYFYLSQYNINEIDKNYLVKPLFTKWINKFQNVSNISVFTDKNWPYFCQFINMPSNINKFINPIKIYLAVDSKHIKEVVNILFTFLANNNIIHKSKVASEIRNDTIVIRVFQEEDAKKISDFIKNNKYIQEGIFNNSLFCFQKDNISYTLDAYLSYNDIVAKYITKYINESKKNNRLDKVSYDDFCKYVKYIYQNVLLGKNNLLEFQKYFYDINIQVINPKIINNCLEITEILIANLEGKSFSVYQMFIEKFNDKDKVLARMNYYLDSITICADDINLFNEYLLLMYEKYGLENAILYLEDYLNTDDINNIPNISNIYNKFSLSFNSYKCILILNGLTVEEYFKEKIIKFIKKKIKE